VVTDPRVDRDLQGLKPMFRSRHARRDADVNRFSQALRGAREVREPAHVGRDRVRSGCNTAVAGSGEFATRVAKSTLATPNPV
jgi:hypothetical protein